MEKDVTNRARDACADAGNLFESLNSFPLEDISHRTRQAAKHVRGFAIRLDPESICALLGKNICDFIETPGDVDVWACAHVPINSR
jgi:hypothetical protein